MEPAPVPPTATPEPVQPSTLPVSTALRPKRNIRRIIEKLFIFFLISIVILALAWNTVLNLRSSTSLAVEPFGTASYLLSEKITYLFRPPSVGDGVMFKPAGSEVDFVGIITAITNDKNITIYRVLSKAGTPWEITKDKIVSRIYYPQVLATHVESAKKNEFVVKKVPADTIDQWLTYTDVYYSFEIKQPSYWPSVPTNLPPASSRQTGLQGPEGTVTLTTGDGLGGGACPGTTTEIATGFGVLLFCVTTEPTGDIAYRMANEGVRPNGFPSLLISAQIKTPLATNEKVIRQIISSLKHIDPTSTTNPTPTTDLVPHYFPTPGITLYAPSDWESGNQNFPEDGNTLIRFWKKTSPDIVPIQLDIKSNWDNTGNAKDLAKNTTVGGFIPASRVDPPTKTEQSQERYQTNVYFNYNGRVFVFECVHNWTQDYVDTCNTMLGTMIIKQR